jgi:hypothetical protein
MKIGVLTSQCYLGGGDYKKLTKFIKTLFKSMILEGIFTEWE